MDYLLNWVTEVRIRLLLSDYKTDDTLKLISFMNLEVLKFSVKKSVAFSYATCSSRYFTMFFKFFSGHLVFFSFLYDCFWALKWSLYLKVQRIKIDFVAEVCVKLSENYSPISFKSSVVPAIILTLYITKLMELSMRIQAYVTSLNETHVHLPRSLSSSTNSLKSL